MSMIERVARAIAALNGELGEDKWRYCVPEARAAIRAMHKPTDEMVEVGAANIPPFWSEGMRLHGPESFGSVKQAARAAYSGMIDNALRDIEDV